MTGFKIQCICMNKTPNQSQWTGHEKILWNLLTFCWIDCLQRQSRWSLCHCSRLEQVGCMMHNWTHKRKWSAPGLLITTMLGITTENMTMLVLKWANTQAFVNLSRNAANSVWSHIPSSFLSKVFNCEFLIHPPPPVTLWSCIPSSFLSKVFNCEFLFILLHQLPYLCKSAICSSQGAPQKQVCYKRMAWKKRMHNTPPQTLLPCLVGR